MLFQDGLFDVNVRQISAVNDPQTFASPVISLNPAVVCMIKAIVPRTLYRTLRISDLGGRRW